MTGSPPPAPRSLPPVAPDVVAAAVAALPARLRGRLDELAAAAAAWPVAAAGDRVEVTVDGDTTVRLTDPVTTGADATCSCLLAPRCLHRAAVLAIAPVLDPPATPAATPAAAPDPGPVPEPVTGPAPTSAGQRDAAGQLWRAAADLLEYGVAGAGVVAQATILQAVHEARAVGLPRPAAAGVRVVERVREARGELPQFRLGALADDLRQLLTTCHQLRTGAGDQAAARGTARRDYRPVGDLRLYGLWCEPVVAASGYAGVVTYLSDREARLWTVSGIQPGDVTRARGAADDLVALGDARLSYRELGKEGLVVSGAYASDDGRLSTGRRVQAVRAAGCGWDARPATALWRTPLAKQVDRYHDALGRPRASRPAGHDLAFVDVLVTGQDERGLLVEEPDAGVTLAVVPPVDDPALPYVPNLRLLAEHARGQQIRMVSRFAGRRVLSAVAFAAGWLPERYGGHADLGVDTLQRADHPGANPPGGSLPGGSLPGGEVPGGEVPVDGGGYPAPLGLLRHRLERVVSGGRPTLRAGLATVPQATHLPTAAALIAHLHEAAARRDRDAFGRLHPHDTDRLARAWLTAAEYEAAAARALSASDWL